MIQVNYFSNYHNDWISKAISTKITIMYNTMKCHHTMITDHDHRIGAVFLSVCVCVCL